MKIHTKKRKADRETHKSRINLPYGKLIMTLTLSNLLLILLLRLSSLLLNLLLLIYILENYLLILRED